MSDEAKRMGVPSKKMSRTINAVIVRSLAEVDTTVSVPQLRVLVILSVHERLNLSGVALEASMEAVRRIGEFAARLDEAAGGTKTRASCVAAHVVGPAARSARPLAARCRD